MPRIAYLAWGSLIWDRRDLTIRGDWSLEGPLVRIEFLRESQCKRITLVLHHEADPVQGLWALASEDDPALAVKSLQRREKCKRSSIGIWSTGDCSPTEVLELPQWASRHKIDVAIWTALGPKFHGTDGQIPTIDQVVDHLRCLDGVERAQAEQYVRRAPTQVNTAYRRKIERVLGWTAV